MKKLSIIALSMTSLFALTGCGMFTNIMSELNKTADALPKTREQARTAVKEYAESKSGVQFTFTYREGENEGTGICGQKDGSMWEINKVDDVILGGYVAIANGDGTYMKYTYNTENEDFEFDRKVSGYSAQDMFKDFGKYFGTDWLFFAHSQQLTKKSSSTILNRTCIDYEFTYGGVASALGEEMEYLVSIDNDLCITMKIAIYEGSSSSSRMNMDMVKWETGNDVAIPEVVEPEEENNNSNSEEGSEEGSEENSDSSQGE